MPAARSQPNACSSQEIDAFVAACFGATTTQTTYNAWQTKEADAGACLGCVFTLQTSKAWGPLVCTSTSCLLNRAGCVDLFLGQVSQETSSGGSGSCGDLLGAIYGCQDYACNTCDTTPPGSSDYDTCAQAAATNECKSYVGPVDSATGPCAMLTTDASPPGATSCFSEQDTDMPAFMNAFCGTGP